MDPEKEKDIDQYLKSYMKEHKYIVLADLEKDGQYTHHDMLSRLNYLIKFDEFTKISFESVHTSLAPTVYTTTQYYNCKEIVDYLHNFNLSEVDIKLCISRARYSKSDGADKVRRSARRSATLSDIDTKGAIVSTLRHKGEDGATMEEVANELGLNMVKAKALFSSLSIGKFIKYNPETKKYKALRNRF